jgi:hypothetical protein
MNNNTMMTNKKYLIRNNVFETNSSSCHSISISKNECKYDTIIPDSDGVITFDGGEFGWEIVKYRGVLDKCDYVATMIKELEDDRLKDIFEQTVKEHTGASEIQYNFGEYAYIDHQSVYSETLTSLDMNEMKELLFNPSSYVQTDNDNH